MGFWILPTNVRNRLTRTSSALTFEAPWRIHCGGPCTHSIPQDFQLLQNIMIVGSIIFFMKFEDISRVIWFFPCQLVSEIFFWKNFDNLSFFALYYTLKSHLSKFSPKRGIYVSNKMDKLINCDYTHKDYRMWNHCIKKKRKKNQWNLW